MKDKLAELAAFENESRQRLKPVAWSDLKQLPRRQYLIKGLLDCAGMSMVYGLSNCGKTFLALDLAAHIALGWAWQGRKTRQGIVVYIACEGGLGVPERLEAFRLRHKIQDDAPLHVIPAGIDLRTDNADTDVLIEEINDLGDVLLVVVDTLSRALAGGNENGPDHMGAFVRNCDRIREKTGAHIMSIHHPGKDATKGARGHNSLHCAIDTEMQVANDKNSGRISIEVKKQRDGRTGDKFYLALEAVEIGVDDDGEKISSCVAISANVPAHEKTKLTGAKNRAVDILNKCLIESGKKRRVGEGSSEVICVTSGEYRQALRQGNISKADKPDDINRTVRRTIDELNKAKITVCYDDYIWLPDKPDEPGRIKIDYSPDPDGQDNPL
jgi:hypothetical protein